MRYCHVPNVTPREAKGSVCRTLIQILSEKINAFSYSFDLAYLADHREKAR